MARTNYTSLGIDSIGKNDADVEATLIRHQPITSPERDAIPDPKDGMKIYNSDNNLLERYINGWPLCSQLTFTETSTQNSSTVIVGNNTVATNTAGGSSTASIADINNVFLLGSDTVVFEVTINSINPINDFGTAIIVLIADSSGGSFVQGFTVAFGSGSNGAVSGVSGPAIETGKSFAFPYTFHIEVNGSDGSAIFTDIDNTTPLLLGPTIAAESAPIIFAATASLPSGASDTIDFTINGGSTAFTFPILSSNARRYCNITTGCLGLHLDERASDNASTIVNDNNTIVTNTAGGESFAAFEDLPDAFILGSETLVYEVTINSASTLNDAQTKVAVVLLDSTIPTAYQGIIIDFGTGTNGILKDGGGTVIETGKSFTFPYTCHIEIDGVDGSGTFTDADNLETPITLPPRFSVGSDTLVFRSSGEPPSGAGDTIEYTINGGSQSFVFPVINPNAKRYCELPTPP